MRVECSDLVVISIPVDAIPLVAVKVLNRVREGQVVIDMGFYERGVVRRYSVASEQGAVS